MQKGAAEYNITCICHLSSVIRRLQTTCTAGEQLAPDVSTAGRRDHWKAKNEKMPVFRIVRYRCGFKRHVA